MPRFLLALTLTLTALTFALALTARAWGGTQPPNPALRGFIEGCEGVPGPCWFGITPQSERVMTLDVAHIRLAEQGYVQAGDAIIADDSVTAVQRYQQPGAASTCDASLQFDLETQAIYQVKLACRGVQAGDWLAQWGMPDAVNADLAPAFAYERLQALIRLDSLSSVHAALRVATLPGRLRGDTFPWAGMIPHWRQCQRWPAACPARR
jgi:hypothetical protein